MPITIFVTAFDEHAVEAFEVEAIDYLLKPVDDARFESALARARRHLRSNDVQDVARRLSELLARTDAARSDEDARIAVRTPQRLVRLRPREIEWIEAADYCIRIHADGKSHLVRDSLAAMEQRLDPTRFVRIHRSAIVNIDHVRELQPLEHGDFVVILEGGEQLRVSRTRRRALEAALGVGGAE
jgi:two-component system LytT family response regulator